MPTIDTLNIQISANSQKAATGINALVGSLSSLQSAVSAGSGLVQSLSDISKALQGIAGVKFSAAKLRNISSLTNALSGLNANGAASMNATASALSALAASLGQLNASGLNAGNIRNLSNLVTQTNRSGGGGVAGSNTLIGRLFSLAAIRVAAHGIGNVINLSNQYQEDLNLFTASLGKYAKEAQTYAETVSEAFGIDPAAWLRNQGVFQTLITGFGVAGDRAYQMSTNLTQLGYDISSFFNVTVQDAMTKLQSGISGELEPLRRLGFDLSEARLKAIALAKGIETSYKQMTQAEKSQLRYEAIMTQVTVAQGDMSRTLNAPANQLRILQAMATQAGRALGNVFIPMLNAIIPVAVAVVKAIRNIANAIASLFGFTLAEVDYSGLNDAAGATGDLADNLDAAGGGAQKLKKALMGFDEINQLPDFTESGGGGGAAGNTADDWAWELSGYDFMGGAVTSKINEVFNTIKPVVDWIEEHIGLVTAGVGVLAGAFIALPEAAKTAVLQLGEAFAIVGVDAALQVKFTSEFLDTGNLSELGKSVLTSVAGAALGGSMLSRFIRTVSGGKFSRGKSVTLGSGIVLGIDAGVQLIANMVDTIGYADDWSWENTLTAAKSSLQGGLSAALIATSLGRPVGESVGIGLLVSGILEVAQVVPSVIEGDLSWNTFGTEMLGILAGTAGALMTFGPTGAAIALGVGAALIVGHVISYFAHAGGSDPSIIRGWKGVQMTANECAKLAQDIFDSVDITAKLKVTSVAVANEQAAKEAILTSLVGFVDSLNARDEALVSTDVNANVVIKTTSEDMLASLNTLMASVQSHMTETKNMVTAYASIGGFRDANGNAIDVTNAFTSLDAQALKVGESLGTAIQEGIQNGFTSELNHTISVLQTDMMILTNALTGSSTRAAASQQQDALLARLRIGDQNSYDTVLNDLKGLMSTTSEQLTEDYKARQLELYTQKAAWESVIKSYDEQRNLATTPEDAAYWKDQSWEATKNLVTVMQTLNEFDIEGSVEGAMDELFGDLMKELANVASLNLMKSDLAQLIDTNYASSVVDMRDYADNRAEGLKAYLSETAGYEAGTEFTFVSTDAYEALVSTMSNYGITEAQLQSDLAQLGVSVAGTASELEKVDIPESIKITLTIDGVGNYQLPTITAHAGGGFPASGSLFIAGERGPELVGRIGSKTAVVNDDQISDTLAKQMGGEGFDENALASAIVGAMRSAGMGAVYLDGKQLAASINNETRRTGRPAVII